MIRDKNGLALSSRNSRLTNSGQEKALELSKSLSSIVNSSNKLLQIQTEVSRLNSIKGLDLEYLSGVNEVSYSKNDNSSSWTHIIIAAEVDGVRLIDNIRL